MNESKKTAAKKIDPKLLALLVCPVTRTPLHYDAQTQELISKKAKLAFAVRDGIAIMLPSQARALDEEKT